MKEKLIDGLEKKELRGIAENLGIGNLDKKNKTVLRDTILKFSYSQITSAMK